MDSKNTIAAIALSSAVIVLWALFFVPEKSTVDQNIVEKEKIEQSGDAPSLEQKETQITISRDDALKQSERIQFENDNIIGSISLKGASIDDLTFKNYKVTLDNEQRVTLLGPRNIKEGYLIDSGFVTSDKNVDVPNSDTIWSIEGNNKLTDGSPIKLSWSEIIDFLILHEGLIATLDDELIEEDYDDIQEKKFTKVANKGWLGISDKYWITSLIPPKDKEFKTTFDYKNKFRANFISTDPLALNEKSSIEEELQIIVAAKRVDVIDGYAEKLNIDKFDLVIDWGFLYFITKPLFYGIDYFFKLLGNYGLAIIAITICIRLVFFPLANFSFKSMAKMKVLQPEMVRLKELHKNDKMKLQQEMMALYKKEKVNPMSGCLPILVQIPVFFALYKVLFVTIEMRQMPFYGWIHDLSERDPTSIFNIFGLLPYDVPSFLVIGAWPVAMGVSMWVQQKLNPAPTDPMQAKIFAFFPLFLTVILAPFPSGLVIYWTVNNILTMAQQVFIMRRTTVKTTT